MRDNLSPDDLDCASCGSEQKIEWLTCLGCHGHEERVDYAICSECGAEA